MSAAREAVERSRRQTSQRRAIREAVAAAGRPVLPEEVLSTAQRTVPGIGIATVYRNLKRLHEQGFLRSVELPGVATTRYELASLSHHHHFHCRGCDQVTDIAICPGDLGRHAPAGFVVESHELVLHGLCAGCTME